jgi:hypothetical protein
MNEPKKNMSEQNAKRWKTEDVQEMLQFNFRLLVAAASRKYSTVELTKSLKGSLEDMPS